MPFLWEHNITLAERLIALADEEDMLEDEKEALWRAISGRAYYAAYCTVRDWLTEQHGYDESQAPRGTGTHKYLRNELMRIHPNNSNARYIRIALSDLFSHRKAADYRYGFGYRSSAWDERTARSRIEEAKDTIATIDQV